MTVTAAHIAKACTSHWPEFPLIGAVVQCEHEYTPGTADDLAFPAGWPDWSQMRPACSHGELPDSALQVERSIGSLRREALVEMLVSGDDDVDGELVENAPDLTQVSTVAVRAGVEQRAMPIGCCAERATLR